MFDQKRYKLAAMKILALLILAIPTLWELYDDRNGETQREKKWDVVKRIILMLLCSYGAAALIDSSWITFFKSLALSFAIFFGWFDYLINLILGRKPWYSYLSKSPIDQKFISMNWRVRMGLRIVVFVTSIIIWIWN